MGTVPPRADRPRRSARLPLRSADDPGRKPYLRESDSLLGDCAIARFPPDRNAESAQRMSPAFRHQLLGAALAAALIALAEVVAGPRLAVADGEGATREPSTPVAANVDLSQPLALESAALGFGRARCGGAAGGRNGERRMRLAEPAPRAPLALLGEQVLPGTSARLAWSPDQSFEQIAVPTAVLVVNGVREGPTLCLTAALHGDELNGIEIVRRVLYDLDSAATRRHRDRRADRQSARVPAQLALPARSPRPEPLLPGRRARQLGVAHRALVLPAGDPTLQRGGRHPHRIVPAHQPAAAARRHEGARGGRAHGGLHRDLRAAQHRRGGHAAARGGRGGDSRGDARDRRAGPAPGEQDRARHAGHSGSARPPRDGRAHARARRTGAGLLRVDLGARRPRRVCYSAR